MTQFEYYTLILGALTAISAIGTAIYAIHQFKRSASFHQDNLDWNKRIETRKKLDSEGNFNSRAFLNELFHFTGRKHPIDLQEILLAIEKDKNVSMNIYLMLNFHETLASGVFNNIYVESIIKSDRKGIMIQNFNLFKDFIEHERNEKNPKLLIMYERLVTKWINEDRVDEGLPALGVV